MNEPQTIERTPEDVERFHAEMQRIASKRWDKPFHALLSDFKKTHGPLTSFTLRWQMHPETLMAIRKETHSWENQELFQIRVETLFDLKPGTIRLAVIFEDQFGE